MQLFSCERNPINEVVVNFEAERAKYDDLNYQLLTTWSKLTGYACGGCSNVAKTHPRANITEFTEIEEQ
jgi:hypothetical protein